MKVPIVPQKQTKKFWIKDVVDENGELLNFTSAAITVTMASSNGSLVVEKSDNDSSVVKTQNSIEVMITSEETNVPVGAYRVEIMVSFPSGVVLISGVNISIKASNTGTKEKTIAYSNK